MNNKNLILGILAHVDAGKTTLSEGILYTSGSIRRLGRVDHKDAFLDTYDLERARGITIFSKQAVFSLGDMGITLLDTPGHVDFSAEMERTLQVLDYAVLVINGADGVQSHTLTLWRLLEKYEIPVFIFVNKMDQEGTDREKLLSELKKRLHEGCVDFDPGQERELFCENLAMCDEVLLDKYLEAGELEDEDIRRFISIRRAVPCYFGSALKMTGVKELLEGIGRYSEAPGYGSDFGAKVFKISRDEQGNRLTHMKITGGSLKVRATLSNRVKDIAEDEMSQEIWEEKVSQIRVYSGSRFEAFNEAGPGSVCAVTGLTRTRPGQGLGAEAESDAPILEPVLTYQVILPDGCDVHQMLGKLRMLEEEEPLLHIDWNSELNEIHAQVMGEVQIEILKNLINERFGIEVDFGQGSIVYKETIKKPVEGVGHFEPLRHYAEVHLLLEPGEQGSGLKFQTDCSEDMLDINWQRQIISALKEKEHRGVLTGSAVTDMKVTLIAGRAHLKHTEGGDFRQAACRALRQGLMKTESILLEPYYAFRLEIPSRMSGRAMADIQRMSGSFEPPVTEGELTILKGTAPAALMREYPSEVVSYTQGLGQISLILKGYEPCHNPDEVREAAGYDPEADTENPTGSVFCAHGAGFYVKWDQTEEYMHIENAWKSEKTRDAESNQPYTRNCSLEISSANTGSFGQNDKELEEIFARTYGPVKERRSFTRQKVSYDRASGDGRSRSKKDMEEYLLVDGYNIIFAWEELKELARDNMMGARQKLMEILSSYQGYRKMTLILVFDAYKVEGNMGEVSKYHNIYVVYTKEAETADQYIEKTVHEIGRKHQVTVATSDAAEQVIIMGQGGRRLSASGLHDEVTLAVREMRGEHMNKNQKMGNYLLDHADGEAAEKLADIRLGRDE